MKIPVAMIMEKFCSYRKEDKKKRDGFKIYILTHMHKLNFTNTGNLIKKKVLS